LTPTLRLATAADFRGYAGRDPDPDWCAQWYGFVAERGGAAVGLGVISRDGQGRVWVWCDVREPLAAPFLHRAAGVTVLHAYCSDAIPSARRWLTRLGFRPDPTMPPLAGRAVWTCIPI